MMERMAKVGERRAFHRSHSNDLLSLMYCHYNILTDSFYLVYIKSGSAEGVPPSICKKYLSTFHFIFQTLKSFIKNFHLSLQGTVLRVLTSSPKEKTDFIIPGTAVNLAIFLLIETHHKVLMDTFLPSIISHTMRTKFAFDVLESNDLWVLSSPSMLKSEGVFLHNVFGNMQSFYYEVLSPLVSQVALHEQGMLGLLFCVDLRHFFLFHNHPT